MTADLSHFTPPDVIGRIVEWPDDAPPSLVRRYPRGFRALGRCRRCGCTARRGCRCGARLSCWWVDLAGTLCSRCVSRPGRRRYRRPRTGHTRAMLIWRWYAERRAGGYLSTWED